MLIGYCRVSTAEQRHALQVEALEAAGCDRIYQETASGAKVQRSKLDEALRYARSGDVFVVWKLDRVGRSLPHLLSIIDDLEKREVGFKSLTEQLDTTTPGGRLIFSIFGAIAEFERGIIKERTCAGLAAARRQGRVGGRPKALDESDMVYARTLMSNPEISMTEIATRLCVSPSTLYRYFPQGRGANDH